ncbi:tyrosine-type recombinase/integrase [Dactylosporangium sp. NPDC048998]|uniref:tyrosine-type recombinase/integrase n=1 Tax=Dactylosporangium sp. NPDC048998 TaxID=3363976 RepID=UPI00372218C8
MTNALALLRLLPMSDSAKDAEILALRHQITVLERHLLVRTPRTLPRTLEPGQVDALLAALRTYRDRAMAEAMVLGGLRRCEVLRLRLTDVQVAARRVFLAEGKGGHQRQIPVSGRFFASAAAYLDRERPSDAVSDRVFVVLKGPRRGRPLPPAGLDQATPKSPTAPSPTNTSPSQKKSKPSTSKENHCPRTRSARAWHACAANTTGSSATATAPAHPNSTAPSKPSAKPAPSSRPASSSAPP